MTSNLKVNIFLKLKDGPWGGGNQFFKAIKNNLIKTKGVEFTENTDKADVIIGVTHHNIKEIIKYKKRYPEKFFIYRLGDVYEYHRGNRWKIMDKIIITLANKADWVIFQSKWSKKEALKRGFKNKNNTIIPNASDPKYFNTSHKATINNSSKINLIATSWSKNKNKGFEFYKFLDDNLDFNKFKMTFIGNSPINFKNIECIDPLPSNEIATQFKKHHIFISPTKNEACSNSIIEALSCGLPVIALDSGSNPEIVRQGGELFKTKEELLIKINQVTENYSLYQDKIKINTIQTISEKYRSIINKANEFKSKKISSLTIMKINTLFFIFNHHK